MADDQTQNQASTDQPAAQNNDAPAPDWLKNANNLAEHEQNKDSVEPVKKDNGQEQSDNADQAEPVAQTPDNRETVEDLTKKELPAWLQVAQGESAKAGETALPKNGAVSDSSRGQQVKSDQMPTEALNTGTAESQPQQSDVSPVQPVSDVSVAGEQKAETAPTGLLETASNGKPKPSMVQTAPAEQTPEVSKTNQQPTKTNQQEVSQLQQEDEKKAKEAVAAKKKKDLFESAKELFVKSAEKAQTAVDQGRTAGVPEKKTKTEAVKSESSKSIEKGKVDTQKKDAKVTAEEKQKLIEAEKIFQEGLTTIRDLIAPSSMEIRYDSLRIEGMYAQSFYVYAYPRYLDTNWLSPIVNFDVTMDIAQFIYPIDSSQIMKVLKKKVTQMQSSVRMRQQKGMVSDPALETALQDAEELRVQIQRGQEKFFQFGLYFTIYSADEKKIDKIAKHLESLLGGKLVLTKKAELQMEHAFNSTLPMCLDELEINSNMNTSPLSSTFPFSSSDLTSDEGILYGLNRHNDSLIIFDRFSLENANSVVFAKSGAGKSYAVKLEILRSMMTGADVIVIDPENEYEALSQTVGGSYLRVSLTSDRRINPFDLPRPLEGEEEQPGDVLRSNIINLNGLLKIMLGGITPEEEAILDKALNDVYALKGITMDVVDPSSIPPPTMEDLQQILSTMEGATSMAQRLEKFTSGTYSGIFNKPTNIDLQSGLMVFSIRDLEDALRPIAMYIILNYIWSRVRSELKRRILVIDEAWTMMQYDDSAKFLFGLVKRARKYFLGITTITQDVEDFIKSPYGKPVVTNSSMQLLLKQAPAAIDILAKIFNLTEGEKYMLLNSGVGQGLFFAGLKHVAIQIIASYTEDKIVTTNPEEILASRETMEQYESAPSSKQSSGVTQNAVQNAGVASGEQSQNGVEQGSVAQQNAQPAGAQHKGVTQEAAPASVDLQNTDQSKNATYPVQTPSQQPGAAQSDQQQTAPSTTEGPDNLENANSQTVPGEIPPGGEEIKYEPPNK